MPGTACFGHLSDGRPVTEFTLSNDSGVVAKILDYGGIIRVLEVPDRHGRPVDVVLGFDELGAYEGDHPYFGAIVGRVAGRLGGGCLPLDGTVCQLPVNDPPNHLHGGELGFTHRVWDADFPAGAGVLRLSYESPAGEEGYPGKLDARVTYRLTNENELIVQYHARADAPTAVNLTQHSYFNLSGDAGRPVRDHRLRIDADRVLELDDHLVPTGRIVDVSGTDLDRRRAGPVGDFDNFWILASGADAGELQLAAELSHEATGRLLQVLTTAPGVQVYSGINLPARLPGKAGVVYGVSSGICFETQIHPDSPNHPGFPGIVLGPDAEFESTTVFRFQVRE